MHGGTSKRGADHHNFKTGKYSSVMPAGLLSRYEALLADSELMELRDEIAVISAAITLVIKQLPDDLDTEKSIPKVNEIFGKLSALIDDKRRLVDSEAKRLLASGQMVTSEQLFTLIHALLAIIENNVQSAAERQAIGADVQLLIDRGSLQ
jgi:hypothetical protein